MTRKLIVLAAVAVAVLSADQVQVTFRGYGSGTLGGIPFVDSDFVVSLTGDNSATYIDSGVVWLPSTSAAFNIEGTGGVIQETIQAFVCAGTNECGGFAESDWGANMIWSHRYGVGLLGYAWTTNFGPTDIMQTGGAFTQNFGADTTLGELVFTSATGSFIMEARVNPVPEPSAFELLGMVILVCAALSRSLSRKASRHSA